MKLVLCNDIKLVASCEENLDTKHTEDWFKIRMSRFEGLIEKSMQVGASYLVMTGDFFGADRVSESAIDNLFSLCTENSGIVFILMLSRNSFHRIHYRNDIPLNCKLMCVEVIDAYKDGNIVIRTDSDSATIQLGNNKPISLTKEIEIPSLEPVGFDDASEGCFGYATIKWTDTNVDPIEKHKENYFKYEHIEIIVTADDSQKVIEEKLSKIIQKIDRDSLVRLEIKGKSPFGTVMDCDAIKKQMERKFFYAGVYDNSVMDVDTSGFEKDISLRSEFVKLAFEDESLSEIERSRLISMGWNVLNGEEVG